VLISAGEVALVRRPPKGLLGGMLALPTSEWLGIPPGEALAAAPQAGDWRNVGAIEHVFTHFALTLEVWRAETAARDEQFLWLPFDDAAHALPSVFLKALRRSLEPALFDRI
jgi:A/G-specific adenine glycosylase